MAATLPFIFKRGDDQIGAEGISSTSERLHGLVAIEGERLVVQWRRSRTIERVGLTEIRTDTETDPVGEVFLELDAIAGGRMQWLWFRWPPGWYAVVNARDLKTFEPLVQAGGVPLSHPAELYLPVRRRFRDLARDFIADLNLAIADRALRKAEESRLLPDDEPGLALPPRPVAEDDG